VLDYTKQDFTELPSSYDIILDLAGSAQAFSLRSCLKPKGICVLIGMSSFGHLLRTALLGSLGTLFLLKSGLRCSWPKAIPRT
jgi:NADPH:quinone reductase-like Zn-dependent oxidoreductase